MTTEHTCTRAVLPYLPTGALLLPIDGRFDGGSLPFAGSWARKQRMFFDSNPGSVTPGSSG